MSEAYSCSKGFAIFRTGDGERFLKTNSQLSAKESRHRKRTDEDEGLSFFDEEEFLGAIGKRIRGLSWREVGGIGDTTE